MIGVILAAGKSIRMMSDKTKLLHDLCGKPVIFYPAELMKSLKMKRIIMVVNDKIKSEMEKLFQGWNIDFVLQKEQTGTATAFLCALENISSQSCEYLFVMGGDTPLLDRCNAERFIEFVRSRNLEVGLISAVLDEPAGYGRIKRKDGRLEKIVEAKEASREEIKINEVNSGIYMIKSSCAQKLLTEVVRKSTHKEYYLTDIVEYAEKKEAYLVSNSDVILGINTRKEQSLIRKKLQAKIIEKLLNAGVTIIDPDNTYIDYDVKIGKDSIIHPQVCMRGSTIIGQNCIIDTGSVIEDSVISDEVSIYPYSVIEKSHIGKGCSIGPFSHLRPEVVLKENVKIGNFVEVKKSVVGENTKASHLTYIGDAEIGKDTNIGAGTITCNYDGYKKNKTKIGDRVFIGSNTEIVAPVEIDNDAITAAGTTVTKYVPPYSLAISRVPQQNIENWVKRYRKRKECAE